MNIGFENYQKLVIKCMIVFHVFINFSSSERITKYAMSHLYFNEERDYSEKVFRYTFLHDRKRLNILTPQLPMYYITVLEQEISIGASARSSHRCSIKNGVLKYFIKFTVKQLRQSLFLNKVAGLGQLFFQNNSGRLPSEIQPKRSKRKRLLLLQRDKCNAS